MRIHITYTGGTIGMIDSPNGLIPGADTRGWLFRLLEDAHGREPVHVHRA